MVREEDMKKRVILGLVLLILVGCATPMRYTDKPLSPYDRDTQYRIDEFEGGFVTTIYYSRYQFIPESSAVALACKSSLTAIAHDYALNKNKKIMPINDQMIRISMGRNGVSGITSCSATVKVQYQ